MSDNLEKDDYHEEVTRVMDNFETCKLLLDWYDTREHIAAVTLLLDQWDSEDTTYPDLEELIQNAIPALRDLVDIIRR